MNEELSRWSGCIKLRTRFIASCASTRELPARVTDLNRGHRSEDCGATIFKLVAICNLLILAIQSAGPARVGALATYAASLSQSFADAQHALAMTTAARDLRGASTAH